MEIINRFFTDFTPNQIQQFSKLQELYTEWNDKINVVSRKDIDQIYERHVLHSLSIGAIIDFHSHAQVLDIGTGGGFPGIPMAIFRPDLEFTLIDSIGKKTKVVSEIANALELKNVEVIHKRAEELKGRSFDFVMTRAVASLSKIWLWANPLIRRGHESQEHPNGLICLKGGDLSEEISESGLRPFSYNIHTYFPLDFFKDKFVLLIKK